jgi:hypothetical protein
MERRTTAHVRPGTSSASFELVCSEVHPTRCHESLNAASQEGLVTLAMQHGAHAHGFTPVWYTRARKATMAAAVTVKLR